MIVHSIDINRTPADVFAYLDKLDRHGEWQEAIIEVRVDTEGPTRAGTLATEKRKVPSGPRDMRYEITEHDPPRRSGFRGLNGPVRPVGTVVVEPIGDGASSRVTLEFDLEGHGIGKLLAPLARMDAKRQIPKDQARLKERLEAGA